MWHQNSKTIQKWKLFVTNNLKDSKLVAGQSKFWVKPKPTGQQRDFAGYLESAKDWDRFWLSLRTGLLPRRLFMTVKPWWYGTELARSLGGLRSRPVVLKSRYDIAIKFFKILSIMVEKHGAEKNNLTSTTPFGESVRRIISRSRTDTKMFSSSRMAVVCHKVWQRTSMSPRLHSPSTVWEISTCMKKIAFLPIPIF